jgi:hypothetical protein
MGDLDDIIWKALDTENVRSAGEKWKMGHQDVTD